LYLAEPRKKVVIPLNFGCRSNPVVFKQIFQILAIHSCPPHPGSLWKTYTFSSGAINILLLASSFSLSWGLRPPVRHFAPIGPWGRNGEHAAGRITRPLRHTGEPYSNDPDAQLL
jgi:hypothetical protein